MKFLVVDLQQNVIAEFKDEFEMDRWLIQQLSTNSLKIGRFLVERTNKGKAKVVEIDDGKNA